MCFFFFLYFFFILFFFFYTHSTLLSIPLLPFTHTTTTCTTISPHLLIQLPHFVLLFSFLCPHSLHLISLSLLSPSYPFISIINLSILLQDLPHASLLKISRLNNPSICSFFFSHSHFFLFSHITTLSLKPSTSTLTSDTRTFASFNSPLAPCTHASVSPNSLATPRTRRFVSLISLTTPCTRTFNGSFDIKCRTKMKNNKKN